MRNEAIRILLYTLVLKLLSSSSLAQTGGYEGENLLIGTRSEAVSPLLSSEISRQVYLWTGGDGDDPNNWDNAFNWNPVGVPSGNDIAVIGSQAISGTVDAPGKRSVYRVDLLGTSVTLNASELSVSVLNIGGGILNSSCTVADTFNWTGGNIPGKVVLLSGSQGVITGSNPRRLTGNNSYDNITISSNAILRWVGPAPVELDTAPVILNGGSFLVEGGGELFKHVGGPLGVFLNGGLLTRTSSSGTAIFAEIQVVNQPGGRIVAAKGVFAFRAALTLFNGSHITGTEEASLIFSGGTITVPGSPNLLPHPEAKRNVILTVDADLHGPGTLNILEAFSWTGGLLSGQLAVQRGAQLFISGGASKRAIGDNLGHRINVTVHENGTVSWQGAAVELYDTPVILIRPGGQFLVETDGTLFNLIRGNGGFLLNEGVLVKTDGLGTALLGSITTRNAGSIFSRSGRLELNNRLELDNGSVMNAHSSAEVALSGLVIITAGAAQAAHPDAHNNVVLAGANVGGEGTLTISGHSRWDSGRLSGKLKILASAQLDLLGPAERLVIGNDQTHAHQYQQFRPLQHQ
jgi:hypothetical protein